MFTQLRVLDYFDFWMKLDDDVRWAEPFPGDITHHLITKRHTFVHSGARALRCKPLLTSAKVASGPQNVGLLPLPAQYASYPRHCPWVKKPPLQRRMHRATEGFRVTKGRRPSAVDMIYL